jgi:hypothetical protein
MLFLAEIGDIQRFSDKSHLCSYAGLVPRVPESGGESGAWRAHATSLSLAGSC